MAAPRTGRALLGDTAFVAVANLLAGAAFWPIYRDGSLLTLLLISTAVGSTVAVLGARRAWPGWRVAAFAVAAFLLLGVPLAVPGGTRYGVLPTLTGLRDLVSAVALSWKQLLTISLPVGSYQALLVPAFLLTLSAAVIGLSVAVRAKYGELAPIAPLVVFGTAVLFGPEQRPDPVPLALAFLLVTLLWLIWRRRARQRTALGQLRGPLPRRGRSFSALRTGIAVAGILAVAVGGAVSATAVLPVTADRQVLRTGVQPPFDPRSFPSPLSAFRSFLQPGRAEQTMLTVAGAVGGDRIRLATLDSYDGVVFSVGSAVRDSASGRFSRVPYRLDQSAASGTVRSLDITLDSLGGIWLPTIGSLQTFSGDAAGQLRNSFYYNDTTGTAAVPVGLRPGERYRLSAVVPAPRDVSSIATLVPGSAPVPELTGVPPAVATALNALPGVAGAARPGQALAAMIAGLRSTGYVSHGVAADEPFSRSGHGADRITALLSESPMLGDAEQYAVAAALMARQIGFPSRVVVGFLVPADANPSTAVALTGKNISAWVEVNAAGQGWVAVDPNPDPRPVPAKQPSAGTPVARPQSVVQPAPEEKAASQAQTPPDSSQPNPDQPQPIWLTVLLAVLQVTAWASLVLILLAVPLLTIVALKTVRRRRRRRAAQPLQRVAGGWREYTDRVRDYGIEPPALATRREVAATVGGGGPVMLAAAVDRATFSPTPPSEQDADTVWRAVAELTASLRQGKTRWERLKADLAVRSLRRPRRKRASGAQ